MRRWIVDNGQWTILKIITMLSCVLCLPIVADATCIILKTPRDKPAYATHACLDQYSVHDQTRQMSVRLSLGYYEADGVAWHETADKHVRLVDTPATETEPADLGFTTMETAFTTLDAKITKPGRWVLGLIQQMFPIELAGAIE